MPGLPCKAVEQGIKKLNLKKVSKLEWIDNASLENPQGSYNPCEGPEGTFF